MEQKNKLQLNPEAIKKFNFSGGMGMRRANSRVKDAQKSLEGYKSKFKESPSTDILREQAKAQKELEEALENQKTYFQE